MNWIAQLFCKHIYKSDKIYYVMNEHYRIIATKTTLRCEKCDKIKTLTKEN